MSDSKTAKYRQYWEGKSSPLHRAESEGFYRSHAAELRLLFADADPKSVLEIGCGDGAMYEKLGFDKLDYRGVDFSQSMLDAFATRHPGVDLHCSDAQSYLDDRSYDMVFSNGVVQYFSVPDLRSHFFHAKSMMRPGARLICASVPWRRMRGGFLRREFGPSQFPLAIRALRWLNNQRKSDDGIGTWYELEQFRELAADCGFEISFYGSLHYMYRFHVVMLSP